MPISKPITNKITNILAAFLLILMFLLGFFSMRGDSATMDELAHTPAGYSYIAQKDMRLNPEHPPLLKDLAGFSVWLGSKITASPLTFPSQVKSWQEDINGQWDFGREFLYKNGNNADQIIFWSRLPMLLIMVILGIYVFIWAKKLYGKRAGLMALFLYSFCPTFLAHGRLVTTDVGAAAAFFIATYHLIKWLKKPDKKNLIIAGIVFGLAMLIKFSLAILVPYFVILVIVWALIKKNQQGLLWKRLAKYLLSLFLIGLIGLALIWPVYQYHVWNYPAEKQHTNTEFILRSFSNRPLAETVIWLSEKPLLRPYGQFLMGLLMVMQRAVGGNTTYFLGEISAAGWSYYFPTVFLLKAPLALLILILIALLIALLKRNPNYDNIQQKENLVQKIWNWVKNHFTEFGLLLFLIIYWVTSIRSNLNIGVRHILPTFPILYVLISGQIISWLKMPLEKITEKFQLSLVNLIKAIISALRLAITTYFKYLLIFILLGWYTLGTILIYPSFLSYFNELVGGPGNGYKYVTDSNLDWGQDLKRLARYVEENKIEKIYVDYFGGGSPEYYLKEKFQGWWGDRSPNDLQKGDYLAVSATFLQGGRGRPAPGFNEKTGYYRWLDQYKPVKVIGYSIWVFRISD